jgi:hypothetical protein
MALLNNEAALKIAKDLTVIAMENSLIKSGDSPDKAAQNVYDFYYKLYSEFTKHD